MVLSKRITFFVVLFGCGAHSHAQSLYDPSASVYNNAVSVSPFFANAFSCVSQPSTIMHVRGLAAGLYAERKFMVAGLNLASLALAYGMGNGGLAIAGNYFGNPVYHEMHTSLCYGKSLGRISIGSSIMYNTYVITGFTKLVTYGFSLQAMCRLSDELYVSAQVFNPPFARFHKQPIEAAAYSMGINYDPTSSVCIALHLKKTANFALEWEGLLLCRFGDRCLAKAGLLTIGPQPFIGLGWNMGDVSVEASLSYHPTLGSTPGIGFNYINKTPAVL